MQPMRKTTVSLLLVALTVRHSNATLIWLASPNPLPVWYIGFVLLLVSVFCAHAIHLHSVPTRLFSSAKQHQPFLASLQVVKTAPLAYG
jgi:hypothetical protein